MNFSVLIDIINSWFVLILFLHIIISKKFECICSKYLSFAIISSTIFLTYYHLHFTNISSYEELYILSILIILLYSIFFKGNFFNKALICIVLLQFFTLSRVWIYIIYYILTLLSNDIYLFKYIIHIFNIAPFISRNIIFILLSSLLCIKFNSIDFNFDYLYKRKKILASCLIFSLINYNLLLYYFLGLIQHKSTNSLILIIIIISILSIVFLIFIISLLRVISEKYYIQLLLNVIDHQLKIQLNHYKNLEDYMQRSRVIVHDTKHHILALNSLLQTEKLEEAKNYIKTLDNDLFSLERNTICSNKLIDSIIHSSIISCSKNNITFKYNVNISDNINIEYCDLAIIFGNLLSNAIESCENIKRNDIEKFIEVSADIVNDNLIAKIRNSTTNNIIEPNKNLFRTTKIDKLNHGIGLLSVSNSIDKYNGSIKFNLSDNIFDVKLFIPLKRPYN